MPNPFANHPKKSEQEKKPMVLEPAGMKKNPFTLRGTGLTKRVAERAETKLEKTATEDHKTDKDHENLLEKHEKAEEHILELKEKALGKDIILDKFQNAALEGLKKQKYACLIGAAGTGKTTVERELISILEQNTPTIDINTTKLEAQRSGIKEMNVAICLCAFTGRAVQQMKRAIPKRYWPMCNTIHTTLGYAPEWEEYFDKESRTNKTKMIFRPTFNATNKLPYKICVVDESGMLGTQLWNELIAALPEDCKIILIGDINQLQPVHDRSVLGFAMLNWPTFALEKIHRQAEDNPIIANAHKILRGNFPIHDPEKFIMVKIPDGSIRAHNRMFNRIYVDKDTEKKMPGVLHTLVVNKIFDPFRDGIIVAQNQRDLGQEEINQKLVHYFNPKQEINGVTINHRQAITIGKGHVFFAVGDKVMALQNDRGKGITNGMTGVVTEIKTNESFVGKSVHAGLSLQQAGSNETFDLEGFSKAMDQKTEVNKADLLDHRNRSTDEKQDEEEGQRPASHIMTVRFGAGENMTEVKFQNTGQYRKVVHAYAFTCHKSQGGEYPTVVIICHGSDSLLLSREWLYTAVTRAQQRVILCYNELGLLNALRKQRIKGNTVKEKAMQFLELESLDGVRLPYLPTAQEIL